MKYIGPRDNPATAENPHPPYVNGDRQAGIKGSVVDGEVLEALQIEIETVIVQAAITPDAGDRTQLYQAIDTLIANAISLIGGGGGGIASVVHDETMTGTGVDAANKLSVIQATTTQRGAIEIATQTEVNAGTDTVRAVTPATFKTRIDALNLGVPQGVGLGLIGPAAGTGGTVTFTMSNSSFLGGFFTAYVAPVALPILNGTSLGAAGFPAGAGQRAVFFFVRNGRVYVRHATYDYLVDMGAYNGATVVYDKNGDTSNNIISANYLSTP